MFTSATPPIATVPPTIAKTEGVSPNQTQAGSDSYIAKVVVASIPHLAVLIERLRAQSEVTTAIVLASPVATRSIRRELLDAAASIGV